MKEVEKGRICEEFGDLVAILEWYRARPIDEEDSAVRDRMWEFIVALPNNKRSVELNVLKTNSVPEEN